MGGSIMARTALALTLGIVLGAAGLTAARHDEKEHRSVKTLAARDIAEKLDGKEAKAAAVEVTSPPARRARRTGTPGRRSGMCWRASTSGPSTTSPRGC